MQIVWAEETKDDFRRFEEFLNPVNSDVARRAVKAISNQVKILENNPEAGVTMDDINRSKSIYMLPHPSTPLRGLLLSSTLSGNVIEISPK